MSKIASQNTNNDKTKKEIEAISEKIQASKLKIKDIVVPLSVGLILILLGVFVFVPMIKTALEFRTEYKDVKQKQETLEEVESTLDAIDQGQFQTDLIDSKEVIPRKLRVSSFMYYIDTLANEKSLISKTLSAGDVELILKKSSSKDDSTSYLGVSGPLSYSGSLENILEFLNSLYSASPYIVSADNVSLRESGDGWRVSLSVTGYYVPESTKDVDFYTPFEIYTKHQDVVDIFNQKALQLR